MKKFLFGLIALLITNTPSAQNFNKKQNSHTPLDTSQHRDLNKKTILLDNFWVKYDLTKKITWDEVYNMSIETNSNNDWRLPTIEELRVIFQNRRKIGLNTGTFWSSTRYPPDRMGLFCVIDFKKGDDSSLKNSGSFSSLLIKTK